MFQINCSLLHKVPSTVAGGVVGVIILEVWNIKYIWMREKER
jgi:hypothetical protein